MDDSFKAILEGLPERSLSPHLGDFSSKDIFAEHKRKAWDKSVEARCIFDYHPHMIKRGVWVHACWRRSIMGRTFTEIKADDAEIIHFAEFVGRLIAEVLSLDTACHEESFYSTRQSPSILCRIDNTK